jgi:hypothetical protein
MNNARTLNFDALDALARVVLAEHMTGKPDAESEADDIARILTTPEEVRLRETPDGDALSNDALGDPAAYMLGFNFALRLGAILATTPPLVTPDLTDLVAEYRECTARWADIDSRADAFLRSLKDTTERRAPELAGAR